MKYSVAIKAMLGVAALAMAGQAQAYKIDFAKGGLVDPAKAVTGLNYTSPFDAEYNATTKMTDIWLTDMNGGYQGRRVFNWTLDESGPSQVWTYNGAFTITDGGHGGLRALNIKDAMNLLIGRADGTVETYARSTGAPSYTDVAAPSASVKVVGNSVHHMAYDAATDSIWTVKGALVADGGVDIANYRLSDGALLGSFKTAATYIEGIGFEGGNVSVYNAGANVYAGHPSDGIEGHILKYSTTGTLLGDFAYETGTRPPFHSEALSFDGTHFWMAGYSDGKVYRLKAEAGEKLVPEPGVVWLMGVGLLLFAVPLMGRVCRSET